MKFDNLIFLIQQIDSRSTRLFSNWHQGKTPMISNSKTVFQRKRRIAGSLWTKSVTSCFIHNTKEHVGEVCINDSKLLTEFK